jgi:hypothetical protein
MKHFCNMCKQQTNHKTLFEIKKEYTPENTPKMQIEYAAGTWRIIECLGCEDISFYETWVTSEDIDYERGMLEENIKYYPTREEEFLIKQQFVLIPSKIRKIYKEAIEAFNNKLYFSCTACLRAIVEGICTNLGINERQIEAKINKLFEKGFLTKQHADILHEHRVLGNKALHEIQIPTEQELLIAIKIIEHTLENIYELQDKVEELRWHKERRLKKNN